MQEVEFEHWLRTIKQFGSAVTSNALSRCRRVEKYEGDLDGHFASDGMAELLSRLAYSSSDERHKLSPRHAIPMSSGVSVRNGTASLANAVRLYRSFRGLADHGSTYAVDSAIKDAEASVVPVKSQKAALARPQKATANWPNWTLPSEAEVLQLARLTTQYIRFLHPDIVKAIVEDNARHQADWRSALEGHGIDADLYLWEGSSCAFPGIRRHAGSTEIARHRGRLESSEKHAQALKLDDNHYPKAIWSFVLRGKPFQNQGPTGYSLAHLADHKAYNNRGRHEFDFLNEPAAEKTALFGLYTSVSNICYMPTALIRPTDFGFSMRNLIQRRAEQLYGGFCQLLPEWAKIRPSSSDEWMLENFEWPCVVGVVDNVQTFLDFREREMAKLLNRL